MNIFVLTTVGTFLLTKNLMFQAGMDQLCGNGVFDLKPSTTILRDWPKA